MSGRIHLKSWCTMCLFLLGIGCTTAAGRIIYVDVDGNGVNDGSSWENAYNFLQDALMMAFAEDEIRVAQGIYRPDEFVLSDRPNQGREETFHLIKGVTLQGGYAGFGEPYPNARDIELYETVLSGDLDGNDIDVNDPADLQDEATRGENSYHVVTGSGTHVAAVLYGFTITSGNANGSHFDGYGVYNDFGGGIYNKSGSCLRLTNCTFTGNQASNRGGGMYNCSKNKVTLTDCTFSGNSAALSGAGMSNDGGNPTLTNCMFADNFAKACGGMLSNARITLTNCTFSGNSAVMDSGAMCAEATLTNCLFIGNSAAEGAVMLIVGGGVTVTNCTFSGNSASNCGGLYVEEGEITLTNSILWGNSDSDGMDESAQIEFEGWQRPDINYNCVQGWTGGLGGTGNIDADPLFVDPNNSDYHLQSEGWRWNAKWKEWDFDRVTSRCIDAGNPGSPLGAELLSVPDDPNNEWGENLRINMGAYGGTAEASMGPHAWALLADLTNDRRVDFNDLTVFVHYWLDRGQCIPGDLNRNEAVDFADFALTTFDWLEER